MLEPIIKSKQESTDYSQFFVLVCNIPSEQQAGPDEKRIIEGLKNKWKRNHNDPDCSRLHIIYLHKNDTPHDSKFKPLNLVDYKSLIYIVGHCKPGADSVQSDAGYLQFDPKTKQMGYSRAEFHYVTLALILLNNIINPDVKISRYVTDKEFHLNSANRRLKIVATPCHAGANKVEQDGTISPSFASRLLDFLNNGANAAALKCDMVAAQGFLIPVSTEPSFLEVMKFVSNHLFPEEYHFDVEPSFHKRYFLVKGSMWSNLWSAIPRHHAGIDYKQMYAISPDTTIDDLRNATIQTLILSKDQIESRLASQITAERALEIANNVLENEDKYPKDLKKNAEFIATGIRIGEIPPRVISKFVIDFETKFSDNSQNHKIRAM